MTPTSIPLPLRLYQAATHLVPLVARRHLRRRLRNNKEHPERWGERLGQPSAPRPVGTLIWLHAVGLGEVMSLRGLVHAMADLSDAHFLITSGTKAAGNALAQNMPPRTIHQFLPLDAPQYRKTFLDHWRPDLCVWAEQDIWPGLVLECAARGIPQAHVVARMSVASWRKKLRFAGAYSHIYRQMRLITTYDEDTQRHLQSFGIAGAPLTGPIKPTAPALNCDPAELSQLRDLIGQRFVWITAPSHPADEALALAAHDLLIDQQPDALLIIAPRYPNRTFDIAAPHAVRSRGELPGPDHRVYLADTFGDLGLMYRLTRAALIGGTNDDVDGHSPWEAVNLGTAILHGPRVGNFSADYAALDAAGAAQLVTTPDAVLSALTGDLDTCIARGAKMIHGYRAATEALARDLVALS